MSPTGFGRSILTRTRETEARVSQGPRYDADGKLIVRKPKRKVAVLVGYCGTGYHGMQYNPPLPTIEAALYDAFVKAGAVSDDNKDDLKKSGFMRAARTDKGVHAAGNVISLKMIIEDPDILKKINEHLPENQIRVLGIDRVNKAFDCRKMCSSRIYEYLLPTFSLVGPKPDTPLFNLIKDEAVKNPGITREDPETEQFWAEFKAKIDASGLTQEQIKEILEFKAVPKEQFKEEDYPIVPQIRQYKAIENEHRRNYRISAERKALFQEAMNQYLGHHNFHNFTLGKHYKDPSSQRFMKEINVGTPFVINGTEWVSIKIHGQSFMLHQIRKMISMAVLVTRTGCPVARISEAFGPNKINIPKAPALGLLLENPVYEGYNTRLQEFGYDPIDFTKHQVEMDAFKMKNIYDKIYEEEVKENVFNAFFTFIDTWQNDDQGNIFEFLTAKGITAKPEKAVAAEAVATEAVATEAVATEAAPVEAAPVEAAPVEAAPVEAEATEAAPVEAATESTESA